MLGDALEQHSLLSQPVNDGQGLDFEENIQERQAEPPLRTTTADDSSGRLKPHVLRSDRWPLSQKSKSSVSSPVQSININIF
jgi:hypothetical protein